MSMSNYETGVPAFDEVFEFLTGDVCWEDHGGCWYRQVSPSCFHVVRIFNWEEEVGEEDGGYHVALSEVDTDNAERIKPALDSCGYALDRDGVIYTQHSGDVLCEADDEKSRRLILCECMHGYGAYAPIEDFDGPEFEPLFAAAVKASNELVEDPDAHEAAMNRPVNKLGSTAREYANGDINSAMMRGLSNGDAGARIMATMYHGRENLEQIEELAKLMHPSESEG